MKPFLLFLLATIALMTSANAQTLDERLQASFDAGKLPQLHGAIVELGPHKLAEIYFPGEDERWGQKLGLRRHGPDTLHDLRSVTKSIVGLLYGIALAEGKVPPLEASLYAQFPRYADLLAQPGREKILVAHALSMQMGLEWNESLPYSDPRNSEIAMEMAKDRYRYALEQPMREPPGQSWIYSGGAVALVGKLIEDGVGMTLDAYAKAKLFAPLGIAQFEWIKGSDGVASAASGLRLTLPDLVKIGRLVAQDGVHDGRQIVPANWLKLSFQPRGKIDDFLRYGYLWYVANAGADADPIVIAIGNGGQRLTVQPGIDFVVASVAGRYNDPTAWQTSTRVVFEFAVPEAKKRLGK